MEETMNPNGRDHQEEGEEIQTELTSEAMERLQLLRGQKVVGISLYGDSIAYDEEEEMEEETERIFFDAELYLADQSLLALYGASAYADADAPPITGLDAISDALSEITEEDEMLSEVGQDEEGGLVLAFGSRHHNKLLVAVSGWTVDHWEELPADLTEEVGDEEEVDELEEDWEDEEEEDYDEEDDWEDDEEEEDDYGRY
ncbi:MAG: hypothetical protein IT330_03080 [Anaerolineae bacterium]|nr:hypothetical protein [Anaerolineae bacterium]